MDHPDPTSSNLFLTTGESNAVRETGYVRGTAEASGGVDRPNSPIQGISLQTPYLNEEYEYGTA